VTGVNRGGRRGDGKVSRRRAEGARVCEFVTGKSPFYLPELLVGSFFLLNFKTGHLDSLNR
jgi:hypothetical protein